MSNCSFTEPDESRQYWYYTYANESTIYCFREFNFQCNATFPGDPDIGGYGVLINFVVFAGITTIAAVVNDYAMAISFRDIFRSWTTAELTDPDHYDMTTIPVWRLRMGEFSGVLQAALCDLQLLTGTGIAVAGIIQINSISMYHLNLVVGYFSLTFNSMWSTQHIRFQIKPPDPSQANNSYDYRHHRRPGKWILRRIFGRTQVQRFLTVTAVGLAIYIQIVAQIRSGYYWDPLTSGRCFRWSDLSSWQSEWLWIVGLCAYEVSVILGLSRYTRSLNGNLEDWLSKMERRSISTCRSIHETFLGTGSLRHRQWIQQAVGPRQPHISRIGHYWHQPYSRPQLSVLFAASLFILVLSWSTRQFLSIVGVTQGAPFLGSLVYVAFYIWNAYDVISSKILNRPLVTDETSWGFGQILPMILILTVVLMYFDAIEAADAIVREREHLIELKEQGANENEMSDLAPLVPPSSSSPDPGLPSTTTSSALTGGDKYARPFFNLSPYNAIKQA